MEIIGSLKQELEQINQKLAALESIKNDRASLTLQAARLKKAIATLSGEPVVRNPMSPEAKERIRIGLEKARAAKAAAVGQSTPAPQLVTSAPDANTAKKPTSAEKGTGRGN